MKVVAWLVQQALIKRVPYQRMLECIVARLAIPKNQIDRLHCCEPMVDVRLANGNGQQ